MVSVVMPAYNEAHHIIKNLQETIITLNGLGFPFEVILVDDGSQDRTWLEAAKLLVDQDSTVRVIRCQENRGKGNAVMCGTWYSRGELVVFLDADMDLHPAQLTNFFSILDRTGADIVIGSKLHPDSHVNYPLRRRLWSAGYYALVRLLFGLPVRDTQTGLKVFRREVLQRVFPRVLVKRFAFDIEVLAVANRLGYKMTEAPVTLYFRRKFGRVDLGEVLKIFRDTLAIFYRLRLRRYYDSIDVEWPQPTSAVEVRAGVNG